MSFGLDLTGQFCGHQKLELILKISPQKNWRLLKCDYYPHKAMLAW